jgi:glycosyltransferase involved in cell wall biosynthesis
VRVVYVSSLPKGGPVAHLHALAPAVATAGADVRVVCAHETVAASFRAAGVDVLVVPLRHKRDVVGAWRVKRAIGVADVVHTQDRRAGLLVRPLARAGGATAVHTYHGLPEELGIRVGRDDGAPFAQGQPSALRRAWLLHGYMRIEILLSRFGAAVAPSSALARFLIEHGMQPARLHVIPHGIDMEPAQARERQGHGGPTVVGVASNLEHEKGVDVLIEACALAQHPVRLAVLGDGARRAELERLAEERGVDASFAGHVDDVARRLGEFDVFALPSRAENFPLAVLEAMAAALPVIATRVGGVPEIVLDGETGVLVHPDDPAALAAAVDSLASDATARRNLGAAGARRVSEEFTADRMARRTLALYESLA